MKPLLFLFVLLMAAGLSAEPQTPAPAADANQIPPDSLSELPEGDLSNPGELSSDPETNSGRTLQSTVFRREPPFEYHSRGRRDPFRALLVDSKGKGEIDTDLLVLADAVLTGVVWSNDQFLAMVKNKDGVSFFLREGDPVYGGRLVSISQTQAVFEIAQFGEYERIVLKVQG